MRLDRSLFQRQHKGVCESEGGTVVLAWREVAVTPCELKFLSLDAPADRRAAARREGFLKCL